MTLNQIPFTAAGNLTRDPELRYTPSGKPVTTVRLAITPRQYSAEHGWSDGATTFVDGQVWDTAAEHVAASLHKGDRVLVVGRWVTRLFTPAQGPNAGIEQRRLETVIDEIGPSLAFTTAQITRQPRPDHRPGPHADRPDPNGDVHGDEPASQTAAQT